MDKPKKPITEDDVVAALLKVKPTPEMPRPGAQPFKKKTSTKPEEKPQK